MELPESVVLSIDDIKPYENNPRKITPEAVEAVQESIERYGYVQPIVVDKEHVIIVGHTRHAALKKLGVTEVPVYVLDVSEAKAREYRLVDNRSSELSEWDHKALVLELREWDRGLLDTYFPEVDLEIGQLKDALITQEEVEKATRDVAQVTAAPIVPLVEVVCPSCFHRFKVKAASLPGLSHTDMEVLTARTRE